MHHAWREIKPRRLLHRLLADLDGLASIEIDRLAGMNARRGEFQATKAAQQAVAQFHLPTVSVCPLAEVSAAVGGAPWLQLYMLRDRGFVRDLLAQARYAGVDFWFPLSTRPCPGQTTETIGRVSLGLAASADWSAVLCRARAGAGGRSMLGFAADHIN